MKRTENRKRTRKPRVAITDQDLERLYDIHATRSVSVLATRSGLSYLQVYNIVHRRVKTVSDRHYRLLFGQSPPPSRAPQRVDGANFRAMVGLWLFLHENVTQSDLYREFYPHAFPKKPDTRMFSGAVRSIPSRLERIMRDKFAAAGLDDQTLDRWLDEMEALPADDRVAYSRIRPALFYLYHQLAIHPTSLLNQPVDRYESGLLKRVPRTIFDRVSAMKIKAETALATGDARQAEKVKEAITGKKPGYTLFMDVAEELQFLCDHARRSAKFYLGRGIWTYRTGHAKRISDERARKILEDCDKLIRKRPDLPLRALPRSRQHRLVRPLIAIMVARTARLLSDQEGIVFEKRVLRPLHQRNEYKNPYHGFTRFDMASSVLGMKQRAFDLMVARNCDIFRSVGRYSRRWYLSDLYLRELSQNEYFELITAKYEMMAKNLNRSSDIGECLYRP